MRREAWLVAAAALAAALLAVAAWLAAQGPGAWSRSALGRALQADDPREQALARPGDPLPDLRLHDLDGRPVDLRKRSAGRPLLINFWASWCAPCREEMPGLDRFSAEQGPNGVQVLGIALDDAAAVRAALRQRPVRYPILVDTPGRVDAAVLLGDAQGLLPYSVLVSADGRIRKRHLGPLGAAELRDWAR